MLQYLVKRELLAAPTMLAVSGLVFLVLYLVPGDPAAIFIGDRPATPERLAQIRHVMGLDRPLLSQYADYLRKLGRGDLGRSIHTNASVHSELLSGVGPSAESAAAAFAVATGLGLGLGLVSALRRGTWVDAGAMLVALGGVSMPIFWLASMLIFVFSLKLGWFPATGFGGWNRLVLPSLALGFISSGAPARRVRTSALDILGAPYVTTPPFPRLPYSAVNPRHWCPNALV